jgi:prepilin-type N-terminal cleavage/methylation domain-containing protein
MMRRRNRGFTLVELLVVVAIIGVLAALLLPAVQAARESARATSCKNNLKQIGIALHNYHDVQGSLPPGWLAVDENGHPDPEEGVPGWAWGAYILPYMEQKSLHIAIDFSEHVDEPENDVVRTILPFYQCPSDPTDPIAIVATEHGGLVHVSRANYAGVFGTLEIEEQPSHGDGVLFHNSRIPFNEVIDGLSNTIFVGERSSRLGATLWAGLLHGLDDAMSRMVGSTDHPPNHPEGHFDDFSSYHPRGAYFSMGDGSVHRINDEIEPQVYRALATRLGGEPVGAID